MMILVTLALFSLLHSLLAGKNIKDAIQRRFGDRVYHGWYRLGYNIFAGLTLLPVFAALLLDPGRVIWQTDNTLFTTVMLLIQLLGVLGLIISLLQIDLGQFSGLAQALAYIENKPLPLPDELLQTGGVYAFVRHPLYLFSLMIIWALPVMTEGLLIFNLGTTLYFIFGSLLEEKRMLRIFGDEYRAYQQRVPWLVPLLRRR